MKKNILKIFSIIALVILMSGCVKYNVNIKITDDKKMNMELIIATLKSMQSEESGMEFNTNDSTEELQKDGWKEEKYEDDEYIGSKLTKTFKNIDDISTSSQTEYDFNALVQEGKETKYMFHKKTENGKSIYTAKFKADANTDNMTTDEEDKEEVKLTEEENEQQKQIEEMTKQMLSTADLKMTIEVPKVISSNATEVKGNKLTWDLTKMKDGESIEFAFEIKDKSSFPIIPIAIGGGILLLIIIIVIVISSKKKKTKNEEVSHQANNSYSAIPEMNAPQTTNDTPMMINQTPEVQPPMMMNPISDVQPATEVVNQTPEVQPPMMMNPISDAQPTTEVVNQTPEVQPPIMMNPISDVQPTTEVVNQTPEVQPPIMMNPISDTQPTTEVVNQTPEVQPPMMMNPTPPSIPNDAENNNTI